jgi:predicted DNA-binding transcriptional regulator AlpA
MRYLAFRFGHSGTLSAAPPDLIPRRWLYPLQVPRPHRLVRDGRALIDRTELIRLLGISRPTAERWFRDREDNAHPPPVLVVGRTMYFDETDLVTWARARIGRPGAAPRVNRDGRTLITRAELARLTGWTEQYLTDLYSLRATSGHPEAVHREGPRLYFDESQCLSWYERHRAAKRASLTEIDRTGPPDELVDRHEAARVLRYSDPKVIDSSRARKKGYFPEPDAVAPLRWKRETLWQFADRRSRPGRARRSQPDDGDPSGS